MIAAVIFVVAFLVLGLGVMAFAFSGRAGARSRRGAPSRAGRRFVAVMVTIVIVALGVAVPLAIGVVNGNDHAKSAPGGVDLNAAQANGRAVFGRYCTSSHHARSGWGITGVAVLFRVLTGLADGLALKELALRVGRHDSPQLWVPRFLTFPVPQARFENEELSGLDGGHSNTSGRGRQVGFSPT